MMLLLLSSVCLLRLEATTSLAVYRGVDKPFKDQKPLNVYFRKECGPR